MNHRTELQQTVEPAQPSVAGSGRPWWQEAALFSAVATVLATLVLGANNYMSAGFERESNLHEVRTKYLDRALDPARNRSYRVSLLTFLVHTFGSNDPMGEWAKSELDHLTAIPDDAGLADLTQAEVYECLEVLRGENSLDVGENGDDESQAQQGTQVAEAGQAGNGCCITCEGLLICGSTVSTPCGSCTG